MLCPEPKQILKYNRIKRIEITSEKDITFLFKGNTASSRVKQSAKRSVDQHSDESEELSETEQLYR